MALPEAEVHTLLEQVLSEFGDRHQQICQLLQTRFEQVRRYLLTDQPLSEERKQLLGAYFTHEYALEAAALFNPRLCRTRINPGSPPARCVRVELAGNGRGPYFVDYLPHRVVDAHNKIQINAPTPFLVRAAANPKRDYEKAFFERKLYELGLTGAFTRQVLQDLKPYFTLQD